MNWADQVKATALTVAAERTAAVGRIAVDAPWSWNAHDVWLLRVQPPRTQVELTSISEPPTPPPQALAPRD